MKDAIHENAEKAAMKEDLSDLKSFIMLGIIERQNVTIESLENKMISLEDELLQIKDKLNEREAFHRITSLRMFIVPQEDEENSEKCHDKMIELTQDKNLEFPVDDIESIYPDGKEQDGKPSRMILRFIWSVPPFIQILHISLRCE